MPFMFCAAWRQLEFFAVNLIMFTTYDFPVPSEPVIKKYGYLLFRHWVIVLIILYCSVGRSSMVVCVVRVSSH
jgi:hypothetical protein